MCEAAGYLLHLGGGGAEELYVPRPDDLLVLQQRLHGEEVSRFCHLISNCKNIPYGQSSAKLPVTQFLGHSVSRSLCHLVTIFNIANGLSN